MSALPVRPSFSQLQKQAKALRKACQSGAADAHATLRQHHPDYANADAESCAALSLREAQLAVAREYGEESWKALKEKAQAEAEKDTPAELRARRIREQTSSPDEIERVVRAAGGNGVRRSERITRGFSCEVHWVTTSDGEELMYRANWYNPADEPHFENEKWALERGAELGLALPRCRYIEHGLDGYPTRSVLVTERVPGTPLRQLMDEGKISDAEADRVLEDAGALLGQLHRIPTAGFGDLDGQGQAPHPTWRAAYIDGRFELERLRQSSANAGIAWALIEEGLRIIEARAHLGDGVEPRLLPGQFDLEHMIVEDGRLAGLIDFEHCEGGDPASQTAWSGKTTGGGWFDAFTGEETPTFRTAPLIKGYDRTNAYDAAARRRGALIRFSGGMGGLAYHGVQDVNTAGMMEFLNWRYRADLGEVKEAMGG